MIRIMVVGLTLLTFGAVAVVYLFLWATLPQEKPTTHNAYEVRPHKVHSATYGNVEYASHRARFSGHQNQRRIVVSSRANKFVSVGHTPPPPPQSFQESQAACEAHQAVHNTQQVACDTQQATYDTQQATYDTQQAARNTQQASHDAQQAACSAQKEPEEASVDLPKTHVSP